MSRIMQQSIDAVWSAALGSSIRFSHNTRSFSYPTTKQTVCTATGINVSNTFYMHWSLIVLYASGDYAGALVNYEKGITNDPEVKEFSDTYWIHLLLLDYKSWRSLCSRNGKSSITYWRHEKVTMFWQWFTQ